MALAATVRRIRGRRVALALLLCACVSSLPSQAQTSATETVVPPLDAARARMAREPDAARTLAEKVREQGQRAGDGALEADARLLLGQLAMRQGRLADAIDDLEPALPLAEDAGQTLRLGAVLATLGIVYDLAGLRVEALDVQRRALALYEGASDWGRASALLTNLGNTFDNQGDRVAAREHYERALAMKREHGIARGVGSVLNNLADFELTDGDPERAVAWLREAIAAHQADANPAAESVARGNLARALAMLGRFDAARSEVDAATRLAEDAGDAQARIGADTARARVLLAQARAAPRRQDESLDAAAGAIAAATAAARELGDRGRLADLSDLLAEVRVELGEHAAAVAALREAQALRESEAQGADAERYALLAARYRSEKQNEEILRLRQRENEQQARMTRQQIAQQVELERQRLQVQLAALVALALAGFLSLLWRRARERRAQAARLEQANRALADALDEAQRSRQRADAVAALNRRLLHLAGEEMRSPLLTLRSGAERLLVDADDAVQRQRRIATMAEAAGSLLRVAEQMQESAALDPDAAPEAAAPVALDALLRSLVEQLQTRATARARAIVLRSVAPVQVRADAARLTLALQELLELALDPAPAGSVVQVDLAHDATQARIGIGDPGNHLPDDEARLHEEGPRAARGRLGFAWAREVLLGFGGELRIVPHGDGARALEVRLPRSGLD